MYIRLFQTIVFFLLLPVYFYGQGYFQQDVDYKIDVKLNDQNNTLSGFETIRYTNNSPESLDFIYFHLWPNAYKNNNTALALEQLKLTGRHHLFNVEAQRGSIDSLNFKVNGESVAWEYHPKHQDICKLKLNQPLKIGESITITTPFRVKIPLAVTSRMGHIGQSYKITQWYPKPAVYDNQGWHAMPYLDMGEFYSEFGSFDVSITLPENYIVAATGTLQSKKEIARLNRKAKETKRTYQFPLEDLDFPKSSNQKKTIRYSIENAHDFAWFADKRFHVLKDSLRLPGSNEKIYTWAFFTNEQADIWANATDYISDAVEYFSKWYGDYPYKDCKAVLGPSAAPGNGMEYPGITVIGPTGTELQLEEIIVHEVAHNWFYGMLGFNERRYPYLDEGLATLSEMRYMNEKYKDEIKLYQAFGLTDFAASLTGMEFLDYGDLNDLLYLFRARKNLDQPANSASSEFNYSNYTAVSYGKSSRSFQYLMEYLGQHKFDSILQDFTRKWKYKHPYPEDLENQFKENTEKDLSWFFDGLSKTTNTINYKIKKYKRNSLLVKNKGNINGPIHIAGSKYGKPIYSLWAEGFTGKKWIELPPSDADKITIDPNRKMLELYRHNNRIKTNGLLRKTEPFKFQFGGLFNNPKYTQIHYLPALAWNYYDKAIFGLLLYDAPFPPDKLDYYLVPAYSSSSNTFVGTGNLGFNFYPNQLLKKINVGFSGKRFSISDVYEGQFEQATAEVKLNFSGSKISTVNNEVTAKAIYATDIKDISDRILFRENNTFSYNKFLKASFTHENQDRSINPYSASIHFEGNRNYIKSWFEGQYKFSYYMDDGLTIRLFGGTFLDKSNDLPWNYAFNLSGKTGFSDYLYEGTYLGRFEPPLYENAIQIFAQQFYPEDGAFALYSPIGVTKDWLISVNMKSSIPLIEEIPIHLYANMGFFGKSRELPLQVKNKSWAAESGLKLSFLRFIDVYFPIVASQNLEKASDYISTRYGEKIRFHIRFNILKPSNITDGLLF